MLFTQLNHDTRSRGDNQDVRPKPATNVGPVKCGKSGR